MNEAGAFSGLPLGLGIPCASLVGGRLRLVAVPWLATLRIYWGRADWTRFLPSIGYWGLWPSLSWSAETLD
jgi:hypothetical protein